MKDKHLGKEILGLLSQESKMKILNVLRGVRSDILQKKDSDMALRGVES
jgi:hypothetical protein